MSLADLENALPALIDLRAPHPREINWGVIAEDFGSHFPADYKQLVASYGTIVIGEFLAIAAPRPGGEVDFVSGRREAIDDIECLHEDGMSHGYMPYPQSPGLIPWGESTEGDIFCWRTTAGGPDSWTIVLAGRNDDWIAFDGTLTEYLSGLVSGEIAPDGLPPSFPGRSPSVAIWE